MKNISLVGFFILAVCGAALLALAQTGGQNKPKQLVYKIPLDDDETLDRSGWTRAELNIVITQGKNGYELSGEYTAGTAGTGSCRIHGTYFPATGSFKGRCVKLLVYSEAGLNAEVGGSDAYAQGEISGTKLSGEDGFAVDLKSPGESDHRKFVVTRNGVKRSEGTSKNIPSGVRPCTADERAAFARMKGAWKAYRIDLTISGSCEQATGTYKVTEWCEGVDTTYNTATPRATGEIVGRMQGNYLEFSHETHWRPEFHAPSKGSGTCSLDSDGSLRCSSLPCSNDALKK